MADAECTALWEGLSLGYTESQGLPLLRDEVAALYPGVHADGVLIGAPQELILIGIAALVDRGDHVVCTWPGYQSLHESAEMMGADVTPLDVTRLKVDDSLCLTDAVQALLRPNTRVVVINAPHNPTG